MKESPGQRRIREIRESWTPERRAAYRPPEPPDDPHTSVRYLLSREILILRQALTAVRDRLTPNQLRRRPRGGPSGTSIVDLEVLEMCVDKMRRNRQPFGSRELAKVSGYSKNTILRWSTKNPGEYDRLRARWHGLK